MSSGERQSRGESDGFEIRYHACQLPRDAQNKWMPTDPEADGLREEAAYTPPPATQRLIDELFREEIIQARKLSPVEKALAGQRLFESACRITLAGIRHQFPQASEEECVEILRKRLILQRRLEKTA
jgi:hypothetical protein